MKRILIFSNLVFTLILLACEKGNKEKQAVELINKNAPHIDRSDSLANHSSRVQFDFFAKEMKESEEIIEVKASIYNNSIDTIYFLTYSCQGRFFPLRYDTLKFDLVPFELCNYVFPLVEKIPPKEYYELRADFRVKNKELKMKLGFDLYEVDESFKIKKGDKFQKDDLKYYTLWVPEKTIGREH